MGSRLLFTPNDIRTGRGTYVFTNISTTQLEHQYIELSNSTLIKTVETTNGLTFSNISANAQSLSISLYII